MRSALMTLTRRTAVVGALASLANPIVGVPLERGRVLDAQRPSTSAQRAAERGRRGRSIRIATLPWTEAEQLLDTSTVVMIPLGAEAKEHGPHLPLNNDWLLAEYFTARVMAATNVVVYPTVNYHFYPGVRRVSRIDGASPRDGA